MFQFGEILRLSQAHKDGDSPPAPHLSCLLHIAISYPVKIRQMYSVLLILLSISIHSGPLVSLSGCVYCIIEMFCDKCLEITQVECDAARCLVVRADGHWASWHPIEKLMMWEAKYKRCQAVIKHAVLDALGICENWSRVSQAMMVSSQSVLFLFIAVSSRLSITVVQLFSFCLFLVLDCTFAASIYCY